MLELGFSRALARTRFKHRAVVEGGKVIYRLADGSGHVSLEAETWRTLKRRFDAESGRILKRARWAFFLLFPCTLLFGLTIGGYVPFGGYMIIAAILGGPVVIYFWQSNRIQRAGREIERELSSHARVAAPSAPPPRALHALEIIALIIAGPHLIFQVYGTFFPNAFRNTPWTGIHLDASGVAAFAVLALIFLLRWRTARPSQRVPRAADPAGRRFDAMARARDPAA